MSGRTSDSSSPASRLKTATKLKLQKRIGKDVDVSGSSTLGSSSQKQEMNLNYDLNDNVSVLGIYEVTTDDTGDDVANETSIGADLKFRWTFK